MTAPAIIEAFDRLARRWEDPEHEPRAEAVAKTLACENRFTEEAVAHAVNQQMHEVTAAALERWRGGRASVQARAVGVLNAGNVPMVELQDFLGVLLMGHAYVGALSSRSPYLLPAFADELKEEDPSLPIRFGDADTVFEAADAVIATGTDETRSWAEGQCEAAGIPARRRLLRGNRYAAAILDGHESEDDLEALAEDALLHEGLGCRNVAIIWAPDGTAPDPLLEAFAHFRAVFPPHRQTPGTLALPKAFLEAVGTPHAYGEGLEFLLSKGPPEVQQPGHVRWVEYKHPDEYRQWIEAHADELQLVTCRNEELRRAMPSGVATAAPGSAHRPPLDWAPDGRDVITFLSELD